MSFTVTVWNDQSTPRFSVPIIDPNYQTGWLSANMDRSQVKFLMDAIRVRKQLWFMKPFTVTTQLLINPFVTKEKLSLFSLEFWSNKYDEYSLRFDNVVIDNMNRFVVSGEFRDSSDSGIYDQVSMTAPF